MKVKAQLAKAGFYGFFASGGVLAGYAFMNLLIASS
jgi:hypothetical protein